ncbi:MAG: DUF3488 and transglutaminase-like domain-containing protein [Planctomycetia bacterium]|nr:DUF3488 and transglutaminase-like domain-containing protein [Planctomycetia bacterium]
MLERLLQISITVTVSVGGCILGLGERDGTFSLMIMVCAFLSLAVTDIARKFVLHTTASNLLTAAATGYFLFQLTQSGGGRDTLVLVSHLLVLLEILIFFRAKTVYTYWLLILLSFQQVVLTAAFPQPMMFGGMIFLYFLAVFTSVYLLAAFRRQQEMIRLEHPSLSWYQPLPRISTSVLKRENIGMFLPRHWFRGLLSLLATAILFGTVGFLFCPRAASATFRTPGNERAEVGFSDSIRLGGLGELLQNHSELFRVRLFHFSESRTQGEMFSASEMPDRLYLRGAVLNVYERGNWRCSRFRWGINPSLGRRRFLGMYPDDRRIYPPPRNMPLERLTWMDFQCDAGTGRDAFAVWPFYGIPRVTERQIVFNPELERLENRSRFSGLGSDYSLLTPALHERTQVSLIPCMDETPAAPFMQLPPPEELPTLFQKAEEWHATLLQRKPDATPHDLAVEFAHRFQISSTFRYSLKPQPRNPDLDPIEDFMKNHPVGHCEYFASALVLMLRSRGVPARVVVGLLTDEIQSPGNFFIVRQSHAHSWVEVKLERDAIPEALLRDSTWRESDWRYGGWLRLDPTPTISLDDAGISGVVDRAFRWLDTMESLWNTYVLRLNRSQQQDSLYAPVRRFFHRLFYSGTSAQWQLKIREWMKAHTGSLRDGFLTLLFSAAVLVAVGVPLFFLGRRWSVRHRHAVARRKRHDPRKHHVAFYLKLERDLARKGYHRTNSQTSLEFIHAVPEGPYDEMVEKYYAIRFGHQEEQNPPHEKGGETH